MAFLRTVFVTRTFFCHPCMRSLLYVFTYSLTIYALSFPSFAYPLAVIPDILNRESSVFSFPLFCKERQGEVEPEPARGLYPTYPPPFDSAQDRLTKGRDKATPPAFPLRKCAPLQRGGKLQARPHSSEPFWQRMTEHLQASTPVLDIRNRGVVEPGTKLKCARFPVEGS